MAKVERPLSPHLQIYRPQITSVLSILHRITGVALGVGLLLVSWWLIAAATGEEYFTFVNGLMGSWFGRIVLFGFSWALFYHFCNGIRHLFWDIGKGFDKADVARSGQIVIAASVVLTLIAWIGAYA